MSFKIKRWAPLRTVDMKDFIPGIKSYQTPGGAGITTQGYAFPRQGKILVLAYDSDDTAIWAIYDPATHTVQGPHEKPGGGEWAKYRASIGWDRSYVPWGSWLMCAPMSVGYYYGSRAFYGWDADLNFYDTTWLVGEYTSRMVSQAGPGTLDGVRPTILSFQFRPGSPSAICRHTLGGESTVVYSGGDIYFGSVSGSEWYGMKDVGGYFQWYHSLDNGNVLYSAVPTRDTKGDWLVRGTFGSGWSSQGVMERGVIIDPNTGLAVFKNTVPDLGTYWSRHDSPLDSIGTDPPWMSNWDYRLQEDGGYRLDEYDLDGIDHAVATVTGPRELPPSYNSTLGWYVGLSSFDSPTPFTVYVLDPHQPLSRPKVKRDRFSPPAGWVGEYAIRNDLALEHVLPFPDARAPSIGNTRPPQIRNDGYIVGDRELFRERANKITYIKDIQIDISSYPWQDEDFWWPGADGKRVHGMMGLFAGGDPTIVGRMPDYMWGMLNPLGQDIAYGLGFATEAFEGDGPSHILRNAQRINPTNFATPVSGAIGNQRRFLSGTGEYYAYCESGTRLQQPPAWRAVVGRIRDTQWTTLIDFNTLGPPGLGETDWTVWSVVAIPKCRALRTGGWLVGATLYFDPWGSTWEWDAGGRQATFKYKDGTDSGQGWVPAKPGYIGPLPIDYHQPVLRGAYDEWTAGRSLYGPDALLVYDNEGQFIECLNDPTLYPPDGREIMVVPGALPRVIYRVYHYGTYSDCAEGWGQYHGSTTSDIDVQGPMYVCYDLEKEGRIQPGAGVFRGFVDMSQLRDYSDTGAAWRWGTVCPSIYDWEYPKVQWRPPDRSFVRAGRSGRVLTPLAPGPAQARGGKRGPGHKTRV